MKKKHIITCLLAVLAATVWAQVPQGTWHGSIEVAGTPINLIFHFKDKESTMDSPNQGARNIPIDITYSDKDSISISIKSINATYSGHIKAKVISGEFRQAGKKMRLDLTQGNLTVKRPQEPKSPLPYYGEEITFKNPHDGTELSGTLTLPKNYTNTTPVVIMVTGSGLQNRDEEIVGHKPFFVISDYLARHGIGALRYDDRSAGLSKGDATNATTETFTQDAEAAVNYMKKVQKFKNVGILGHSEGGLIGIILGAKDVVRYVVTLAAPAQQGNQVLLNQAYTLLNSQKAPDHITSKYTRALNSIYNMRMKGEQFADPEKTLSDISKKLNTTIPKFMHRDLVKVMKSWTPWLDYIIRYNPVNDIQNIKVPILALYGEKDTQVLHKDNSFIMTQNLPENPLSQVRTYPGLNHLFQHAQTGSPLEYGNIEETISPEILEKITTWIKSIK